MAEMCPFPSPTRLKGCRKFKNNRQEPSRQLCRRDGRPGRTWGIAHRRSSKSKAPGDKCTWGMTATARRRAAFLGKWQDGALRAQSTAARVRRHGDGLFKGSDIPFSSEADTCKERQQTSGGPRTISSRDPKSRQGTTENPGSFGRDER